MPGTGFVGVDPLLHHLAADPLEEGRACLTAHAHHPDFLWQRNFQIRGDLERSNGDWRLVPHKLVGGFELPPGRIPGLWQFVKRTIPMRKRAKARLRERV